MHAPKQEKKEIQVTMDRQLADQADAVFKKLGIDSTHAVTLFLKKVVAEGALPFDLQQEIDLELRETTRRLPVERLATRRQVEAWFTDETQDY